MVRTSGSVAEADPQQPGTPPPDGAAPSDLEALEAARDAKRRLLQAAAEVAQYAASIAMRWYRTEVSVEIKGDGSPVTIADREAERAARAQWLGEQSGAGAAQYWERCACARAWVCVCMCVCSWRNEA